MSDLPLEFRKEIIGPLVAALQAGQSCSLVGVGSSGKSNVVRHFNRQDVREHYLGEAAQRALYLYVNCAKLTENTARELYCLILEVIGDAAKKAMPEASALHSSLATLWDTAIRSEVADLARRNLGQAFDAIFQAGFTRAFISLDDFDRALADTPGPVLNSLRAFRDDHKQKIMYVTVTRRELQYLRDPDEFEDFFELVVVNSFAIGPYSDDDARFMIRRLAMREASQHVFSGEGQERLLEFSGRHAGLIRTIYEVTRDRVSLMDPDLLDQLQTDPDVKHECEKIWASLEPEERDSLRALVSRWHPDGEGREPLLNKGMIWQDQNGVYTVFSPVFANFVAGNNPVGRLQIELLPWRKIKINNRFTGELTDLEYQLFSYVVDRHPKPVPRKELLEKMLAAEARQPRAGGSPERRLDSYFEEIKRKIELYNQEYIFKLPDGSYRLPLQAEIIAGH